MTRTIGILACATALLTGCYDSYFAVPDGGWDAARPDHRAPGETGIREAGGADADADAAADADADADADRDVADADADAVRGPGTWIRAARMAQPRTVHRATRLEDGRVLVTGGATTQYSWGLVMPPPEIYDPATDTWQAAGNLHVDRQGHEATLLPDGRVLVAGGSNQDCIDTDTAELYDPHTGSWTTTGRMGEARSVFAMLALPDGRVLAAGGWRDCTGTMVSGAEIYDPATGAWSPTGRLLLGGSRSSGVPLPDGRVLVAGGTTCCHYAEVAEAELYDPATGLWTATGSMNQARENRIRPVLLADGVPFMVGSGDRTSSESYDLATGTWSLRAPTFGARSITTATTLPDGRVLAISGADPTAMASIADVEAYDPALDRWHELSPLPEPRMIHTATLLLDGRVLVVGGCRDGYGDEAYDTAWIFDPGR